MGRSDCDGDLAKMQPLYQQHVVVMRHGERRDNAEPLWAARASRRWDPPLTEEGKAYAFKEGRNFLAYFNFPIHRVFVSPFLRCLQTANEVVSALCAADYDPNTMFSSPDVSIDPSKIKASPRRQRRIYWMISVSHYKLFLRLSLVSRRGRLKGMFTSPKGTKLHLLPSCLV